MRNLFVAFTIPRLPIATIVFRLSEYSVVFLFHCVPMRRNILHDVGDLLVCEIKLITNQVRRPSCVEVIHDTVERQPAAGNG